MGSDKKASKFLAEECSGQKVKSVVTRFLAKQSGQKNSLSRHEKVFSKSETDSAGVRDFLGVFGNKLRDLFALIRS